MSTYHKGDLSAKLLTAALALLREEGMAGLSLRAAARAAGVSAMAPYRHFADKEALLAALAAQGFAGLATAMRVGRADPADPFSRLRGAGAAYVVFAAEQPELFRLMFGPEVPDKTAHPALAARGADVLAALAEAVEPCLPQAGHWSRGDVVIASWAAMQGLAALVIDGRLGDRSKDAGTLAERVAAILIEGVRAPASAA